MNNQKGKRAAFEVDRVARNTRRRKSRTVKHTYILQKENEEMITRKREYETCPEDSEGRQVLAQVAQSFVGTIEFYKSEHGGARSHDDAVKEALKNYESRRGYVAALLPEEVTWGDLASVADVDTDDALQLWARLREAADDELECGKRGSPMRRTGRRSVGIYVEVSRRNLPMFLLLGRPHPSCPCRVWR